MSFLLIFGTAKNMLLEQTPLMMMATTNFPRNYRPISNNRTWTSESIVCSSCSRSAPREEADDESVMSRFNRGLELAAGTSVGFPRQTSRGYWTRTSRRSHWTRTLQTLLCSLKWYGMSETVHCWEFVFIKISYRNKGFHNTLIQCYGNLIFSLYSSKIAFILRTISIPSV